MATCELCLIPRRATKLYAARLLDGSRDTVRLCRQCRRAFRSANDWMNAPLAMGYMAATGAKPTDSASARAKRHTDPNRIENGLVDWRRVVYGGTPARR